MKFRISDSAAAPLVLLAVTARIVAGIAIDEPGLYCADWLSALLGGILCIPPAIALIQLRARAVPSPAAALSAGPMRLIALLPALAAAFDSAVITRSIGHSVSYIDLGVTSPWLILLPLPVICLASLGKNGESIGASARLWLRLMVLLLAIILLLGCRAFRPAWLTPILGGGLRSVLIGALRTAGWLSLSFSLVMFSEKDPVHPKRNLNPIRLLLICSLLSALLLLMCSMMTPPLTDGQAVSRYFRFDSLLSNGRAPSVLQFPMLTVWFIGMLILLLFDVFVCASMLQTAFPSLKGGLCSLAAVLLAGGLILAGADSHIVIRTAYNWLFAVQSTVVLLVMLCFLGKEASSRA